MLSLERKGMRFLKYNDRSTRIPTDGVWWLNLVTEEIRLREPTYMPSFTRGV